MALAKSKYQIVLEVVSKSRKAFDSINKGMKKIKSAAGTATKSLAKMGLVVGGLAASLVFAFKKSFDFIDALGKTSLRTGITTKTLQAFQLAAIESGSSIEQTQKGLIKFARSIGDAGRGLKTQADIFKDLGVEIKNSDGTLKSFDEILMQTADGIKNLGSDMERTNALANLFGRSGAMMSEVFRNGAQGLEEFMQRAKGLGIILDQDIIDRTQQFNDTVAVIKLQLGALFNNMTTAFLPALEKLAEHFGNFMTEIANAPGGFRAFGQALVIDILLIFEDIVIAMMEATNTLKWLATGFGLFADRIAFTSQEMENFRLKISAAQLAIVEMFESGDGFVGKFGAGLTDLLDPIDKFRKELEEVNTTLKQTAVSTMKKFEDTIVEGLRNGKLSFKNFADFVIEQMLRIAIQQAILRPLTNMMGGFAPGGGGPDLTQGKLQAMGGYEGGGFTGYGSRTGGIDGRGGFPAILHPNETVIDHTKGGGMGTTVNFNINTVDASAFDSLLVSRKQLITQIINNAMNSNGKIGVV